MKRLLSGILALSLAWPPGAGADVPPASPPVEAPSESPSLQDALPAPFLTRNRLHAALQRLSGEEASVTLEKAATDPRVSWLRTLLPLPVVCWETRPLPADRPFAVLVESPDDPALQKTLRRILDALPEPLFSGAGTAGASSAAAVKVFRESAVPDLRRAAADLLMELGVLSAFPHFLVTAAAAKTAAARPESWENQEAFHRYRRNRAAAAPGREQIVVFLDALSRALEPVEQRAFGLELWALEKNRAAYETGELSAADYVRRLLDKADALGLAPVASTRQARRLAELLSLEDGMDWETAREERDRLIESLFKTSPDGGAALLRGTEALAAGRLSPARHAELLLAAARRAGAAQEEAAAFRRFSRYADLAENLDLASLRGEVRRLEESLFGPGRNTPAQRDLLDLARDLRALRKTAQSVPEEALSPEDPRGGAWAAWLSLPERAESLAQAVELTVPRPAFSWPQAVEALRVARESLRDRAPLIVENAFRNHPRNRPFFLVAPPTLLSAVAEAFQKKGAGVLVLSPSGEPAGLPPAAAALARVWGLRRLQWDETEPAASARASAALTAMLLLVLGVMKGETAPAPPSGPGTDAFLRRLRIRVRAESFRRGAGSGAARLSARGEGLAPAAFLWRWKAAPPPPGFQEVGTVPGEGGPRVLSFRAEAGARGPWRWASLQARAVKAATQRFFQMQKRATLLTGAWMAGGVVLSVFVGIVSVAFLIAWMAVGLAVLVGIVFYGRDSPERGEWSENLKTIGQKRKAFLERVFSSRSTEER